MGMITSILQDVGRQYGIPIFTLGFLSLVLITISIFRKSSLKSITNTLSILSIVACLFFSLWSYYQNKVMTSSLAEQIGYPEEVEEIFADVLQGAFMSVKVGIGFLVVYMILFFIKYLIRPKTKTL